jgi:hypothetical protein
VTFAPATPATPGAGACPVPDIGPVVTSTLMIWFAGGNAPVASAGGAVTVAPPVVDTLGAGTSPVPAIGGAITPGVTGPTSFDAAATDPAALVAVTTHRIFAPTSEPVSTYELAVAAGMSCHGAGAGMSPVPDAAGAVTLALAPAATVGAGMVPVASAGGVVTEAPAATDGAGTAPVPSAGGAVTVAPAVTGPSEFEGALEEPAELVAVTTHRMLQPASVPVSRYALAVAPEMSCQASVTTPGVGMSPVPDAAGVVTLAPAATVGAGAVPVASAAGAVTVALPLTVGAGAAPVPSTGGAVTVAPALAATGPSEFDGALAEPPAFVAVTTHRMSWPTSEPVSRNELAVAPEMSCHSPALTAGAGSPPVPSAGGLVTVERR